MFLTILKTIFLDLVLPIAVDLVKRQIGSSSSKQDDKILSLVQEGAKYLAPKPNNTILERTSKDLLRATMRVVQKAK